MSLKPPGTPPVISIIAICYNHERFVIESLSSIHQLKGVSFELIFCDDCSTDQSAQIATDWLDKHHSTAVRVLNKKNIGLCATLNTALRMAKGTYIKFVACDDTISADKIVQQIEKLEGSDSDVVMCCGNFDQINEDGEIIRKNFYPNSYQLPDDLFLAIIQKPMVFSPQTAVWRKSIFEEIGGFDESYSAEGFHTWLKIFYEKYRAVYLSEPVAQYRIVQNSFSHSGDWDSKFAEQRIRTLKLYDCKEERGEAIRKRQQKEYHDLVVHAYGSKQTPSARIFFRQFLDQTSEVERAQIENQVLFTYWGERLALWQIAKNDVSHIRKLIQNKKISTGNTLIDFLYIWHLHYLIGGIAWLRNNLSKLRSSRG